MSEEEIFVEKSQVIEKAVRANRRRAQRAVRSQGVRDVSRSVAKSKGVRPGDSSAEIRRRMHAKGRRMAREAIRGELVALLEPPMSAVHDAPKHDAPNEAPDWMPKRACGCGAVEVTAGRIRFYKERKVV